MNDNKIDSIAVSLERIADSLERIAHVCTCEEDVGIADHLAEISITLSNKFGN